MSHPQVNPATTKPGRERLEVLEKIVEEQNAAIQQLAKGMKRAEKIAQDNDGEILMEKCTVVGVEFPGPDGSTFADDELD